MNHRKRPMERSACDRCHSQKLRCIRGSLPNGACQRCIKARETCQYGPPLRLGRPANKAGPKCASGATGVSTATSSTINNWPPRPAIVTGELERPTEEDVPIDFPQLGIEAHGMFTPFSMSANGQTVVGGFSPQELLFLSKLSSRESTSLLKYHSVSAARTPVFPRIPGTNQTQHGVHTGSSKLGSSDFILDDDNTQFMQDWAYVLDSHVANIAHSSNAPQTNSGGDLSIEMFPAQQPTETEPSLQPNAQNNAQRQLSELLKGLYENPGPITSNTSRVSNTNLQLMAETVKAANTLLSIIDSLKVPETIASPTSLLPDVADTAESHVDADTVFLISACYSRIFRDSSALATVLHDAISSNDMGALHPMPSITIGSLASFPTISPAIQSALWAQLLRQSLRELEKRLLTLACPSLPSPPTQQLLSRRPMNKSHIADLVRSIDADVAGLEVSVNHLLKTTLDMLR